MSRIRYYFDSNGLIQAATPPGLEELGRYYVSTVQGSLDQCERLIVQSKKVEARIENVWESTGNAHMLTMSHADVVIENLWDETSKVVRITHKEFREATQEWVVFLRSRIS